MNKEVEVEISWGKNWWVLPIGIIGFIIALIIVFKLVG